MKKYIIVILTAFLAAFSSFAQDTAAQEINSLDPVLENIIRSYRPWHSVEFNGKLITDKLPVSPTIKMYMVRDSLVQISLRAPLLGEVARLNITPKEFLIVNKMKHTYCQESSESIIENYPSLINEIQNLFLARVVVQGRGELNYDNALPVNVKDDGEGNWIVVPEIPENSWRFKLGYLVGANSLTRALMMTIGRDLSLEVIYSYKNRGEQMNITFDKKGKTTKAELDFSTVRWGGTEMSPLKLSKYERVSIETFFRSLK